MDDEQADDETVSLRAARNIVVEEQLEMSHSGFDAGCTFKRISCEECSARLGRVYASTTLQLDGRRGMFSFDNASLNSYQLGSCGMDSHRSNAPQQSARVEEGSEQLVTISAFEQLDKHVDSLTEATNKLTSAVDQQHIAIKNLRETDASKTQIVSQVQAGLEHAQSMILLWEERFQRLDECEQHIKRTEANLGTKLNSLQLLADDLQEDWRKFAECEQRIEQSEVNLKSLSARISETDRFNDMSRIEQVERQFVTMAERLSITESGTTKWEERLARIEKILTLDKRDSRGPTPVHHDSGTDSDDLPHSHLIKPRAAKRRR